MRRRQPDAAVPGALLGVGELTPGVGLDAETPAPTARLDAAATGPGGVGGATDRDEERDDG